MARVCWQDRVVIAPDLHHGEPYIRGTRIPVATIPGSLADRMGWQGIVDAYPQLREEVILAALDYPAEVVRQDVLAPLLVQQTSGRPADRQACPLTTE